VKVLFVLDSPEYLRFYDSAIDELARRGHRVAMAVINAAGKKPVGLSGLQAYADRVRVLGVVPRHVGVWGRIAHGVRGAMDFVRYFHPRFAVAPALRARMKRKAMPAAYRWLDVIRSLPPATVRRIQQTLMAAERAIPVSQSIVDFIEREAPDVVLVSPLVDANSEGVDWIKAAQACGIRTGVCVASWDNLTNKGLLRVEPDLVVVWNEAQKREAHEYHYIPQEKIAVTGAQLFDRWFVKQVTRGREEFCRRVGLPDTAPFLLFTGSSSFIAESRAEAAFVRRWIQAVRASADPVVRRINILVRPHPYNCHAWDPDPVADLGGVTIYPRQGYNPIDDENRADFYDSLHHSAAIVGINTSAMIEAAIVGRPVFSIQAAEFSGTQEGTIHFHYLLPENGGFVRLASSIDEHLQQLQQTLRDPEGAQAELTRFVHSFVRPHGVDTPATPIFADTIERLAAMPAPAPRRTSAAAYPLRAALLLASAYGFVGGLFAGPEPLKPLRKLTHRTRKSVDKQMKVARKRWEKSVVKPLRALTRS
jgi:hypothetical protein